MDSFQEQSLQIAKSYISSVVYIDDQIFDSVETVSPVPLVIVPTKESAAEKDAGKNDVSPELQIINMIGADPHEMTEAFGQVGIQCSFLQYGSEADLPHIECTIKKADIIILDWQMHNDLGDAAIKILQSYCDELKDGMHLFIVWTAEPKLDDVREKIIREIPDTFNENPAESTLDVCNSKVIVCRRSSNPDLCSVHDGISVNMLPDFILNKFSSMNGGLVSNTLLSSISLVKRYSSWLLKYFNKSLDNAYLAHRAMCPHPEDGEELLIHMISDAFASLIRAGNSSHNCNLESIGKWIDSQNWESVNIVAQKNGKKENIQVSSEDLKRWQGSGYKSIVDENYNQEHFDHHKLRDASLTAFRADVETCSSFSKLSYKKNHFDEYVPVLTLGTVIEKIVDGESSQFYVCIQQRCDSVRIVEGKRSFVFLPIYYPDSNQKTQGPYLIINDKTYCVCTKSYAICSILFETDNDCDFVKASKKDNNWIFKSVDGLLYRWLFDLKDLHAQRIAQSYASDLSRVGLDESEWLRRKGYRNE